MTVDLIVNPASGRAMRRLPRTERAAFVSGLLRAAGVSTIRTTQTTGPGDATRAVQVALDSGSDVVLVWGGDGTLNEAAGAMLGTGLPLGVIAGGSGNGFARGLGVPRSVERAVHVALHGTPRDVDTGMVSGRAFLNVAGVGLDAAVAARVNTRNERRGLLPYLTSILREWRSFDVQQFRVALDDAPPVSLEAHFIVVCNGPQYGLDAEIAPAAAFDDGVLDVVAIPRVTAWLLARHGWRLFNGTVPRVPGVFTGRAHRIVVSQDSPLPVHLDGELMPEQRSHTFDVRPGSLRVMR